MCCTLVPVRLAYIRFSVRSAHAFASGFFSAPLAGIQLPLATLRRYLTGAGLASLISSNFPLGLTPCRKLVRSRSAPANSRACPAHNIRRCTSGLVDGATPIIIRGAHVANLATGQILFEKPDVAWFRKQGQAYGYDIEAYLTALSKVPVVTEDAFKKALKFLSEMSVMLAEQGLATLQNRDILQAVRKSEEYLRITLNSIGDAVISTDDVGKVTHMNPVAETLTGWRATEACGEDVRTVLNIVNANTREPAENPIDKVLKLGKIVGLANHTVLISKDTTEYQIADSAAPITNSEGHISGVVLVFRDVTEKYKMEEALEKRLVALTQPLEGGTVTFEDLFNINEIQRIQDEFANATGVASIITHADGTPITKPSNFTHLCSEIVRKSGKGCENCLKSDALIGRFNPGGPIVLPCLSAGLWDAGANITVGGKHIANWLIGQVRDKTQTEEHMRGYAREIGVNEAAFIKAFYKVPAMSHERFKKIAKALFTLANQISTAAYQNVQQARFITAKQKAEAALKESETRLSLALAVGNAGIWEWNRTTNEVHFDARFHAMLGYTPGELPTNIQEWLPYHHPDDVPVWQAKADAYFKGEAQVYESEHRIRSKEGNWEWIFTRGKIVESSSTMPCKFIGIAIVTSDRKRTETELLKMQKLISVGTLAGGIAHDFNNILMGLFGNIALAKTELTKDHPSFKPLDDAEKSMTRAIRLTKQLLTFAKGGEPITENISLGALVEDVAQFDLTGSNIMLIYSQVPDLWLAKADKGQIQQVISNLTINSRQAMPNGGRLFITLENSEIQNEFISSLHPGKYIKITVRDEGVGIDPKIIDRIFDPYFTTKQSGSGLGLATTYSIINKHGGHIVVESELGKGTTFTLYLPASESPLVSNNHPSIVAASRLKHTPKILILDDEEFILMVIPRWLKSMGCLTQTTSDGQQAIDLYKQAKKDGTPFDAMILDLTIPGGMGGEEVVRTILAFDPDAKAIASSGYAEGKVMANYAFYGFKGVIAKPYTEKQLCDVLGKVLSEQ